MSKNQKRCWKSNGSLLPEGSKKVLHKLRSKSNIVIAAAKTGKDNTNKNTVIKIDQIKRGKL